jgi:imidazoleglycerol-phosphate dehydratase
MAAGEQTGVRIRPDGSGVVNVDTGLPILDHLLALVAEYGGFDLALGVAPGSAEAEVAAAGRALGEGVAELLAGEVRGHGAATTPADEALAHVALEASGRPLLVSNVDLSEARVAGLGTDLAARFLEEFADAATLTLHVRLMEGRDTQHVLEAIFKALGVALAQACRPRPGKE